MKKFIYIIMMILSATIVFTSCDNDDDKPAGNPVMLSKTVFTSALFGDSIPFTFDVTDAEVPLSTLKAQLYFGEEMVSETVIRTKENGEYSGKIFVPFYANIPNGTATLKFVLQNINFTKTEQNFELPLTRPDYTSLTLVAEDGTEYTMNRQSQYNYSVTNNFPQKIKAYIKAPAMGANGNEIIFGSQDGGITQGVDSYISFSNTVAGTYNITFNTLTYEASPFVKLYVNGTEMTAIDDNNYRIDLSLTQGQEVSIEGTDFSGWWIDSDFFSKDATGKLTFLPISGDYRITANFVHNYFIVETLSGGNYAALQSDGSGAIWIIGDNVGKPTVAGNVVGWNTDKALCLAPIGGKKYQVTLVAGESVTANTINFKFFHQKGWGGEFGSATLSTTSDVVFVGDGANGRDSGNLGIVTGKTLEVGATYVFTVDLSGGNSAAVLTVVKK